MLLASSVLPVRCCSCEVGGRGSFGAAIRTIFWSGLRPELVRPFVGGRLFLVVLRSRVGVVTESSPSSPPSPSTPYHFSPFHLPTSLPTLPISSTFLVLF